MNTYTEVSAMQVYHLSINSPSWDEIDSQLLTYVSTERQGKILRYVNISDRKLSLYAALIVRMGLSQMTGLPIAELFFSAKANHKPMFLSAPNYDFSISHTHGFVLCCISSDGAVGADTEKLKDAPFEIMRQVFHPTEIQYVQYAPPSQKELRFFEIWTRKEAYTKQMGTGLVLDLPSCNTLSPSISPSLRTWIQDGYMCCICGKNPPLCKIEKLSAEDIRRYFIDNIKDS